MYRELSKRQELSYGAAMNNNNDDFVVFTREVQIDKVVQQP